MFRTSVRGDCSTNGKACISRAHASCWPCTWCPETPFSGCCRSMPQPGLHSQVFLNTITKGPKLQTDDKMSIHSFATRACQGGIYNISIKFSRDYPFEPPTFTFFTRILHPNVIVPEEVSVYVWYPACPTPSQTDVNPPHAPNPPSP